jgi:hypothetical protein
MMNEKQLEHRLIQLVACAEMVLAGPLPKAIRKLVDKEKVSVTEQADYLGEHPRDEALEILKVGCMLIQTAVEKVDQLAVQSRSNHPNHSFPPSLSNSI